MVDIGKYLEWYERATWLRALVQLPPGGGSVDVVLAGKAAALNQQRVEELLSEVSSRLETQDEMKLDKHFLTSEEFFEVFRTAAEIVARSASAEKRRVVAAYLSDTIANAVVTDLSNQVLEDMRFMQPVHLQVLAALPAVANQVVSKVNPPEQLQKMPASVYEKTMSDLERYGFIRYNTSGIGTLGGGGGHWETTDYIRVFREHVKP